MAQLVKSKVKRGLDLEVLYNSHVRADSHAGNNMGVICIYFQLSVTS